MRLIEAIKTTISRDVLETVMPLTIEKTINSRKYRINGKTMFDLQTTGPWTKDLSDRSIVAFARMAILQKEMFDKIPFWGKVKTYISRKKHILTNKIKSWKF